MKDPLPQDLLAELNTTSDSDGHPQVRIAKRRSIDFLELTAPMRGEVLDVSARGMRIQTTEPLYVGSRRTFSLADSMGRQQKLAGYVRWSRLSHTDRTDNNGNAIAVYTCGVERCRSLVDPATL